MNCKYCQQEIKRTAEMGDDKVSYINYLCETCHVDYEFRDNLTEEPILIEETFFVIKIKDRNYEVKFHYGSKQTSIYYWTWIQVKAGNDSLPSRMKFTLHTFDRLLDWTPFNAKDKLAVLLPFF